jgi:hypothetical protein
MDDEMILTLLGIQALNMQVPHKDAQYLAWLREFEPQRYSRLMGIVDRVEKERRRERRLPAHDEWRRALERERQERPCGAGGSGSE